MKIGPNKYQLAGKIFLLILVPSLAFLLIVSPLNGPFPVKAIVFLSFAALFLISMYLLIFLELFFLPTGVVIDNDTLQLRYFVLKPKTLRLADITNYQKTKVSTKSNTYECLLLNAKDGKAYLLGNFNLKDYGPIKAIIDQAGVPFEGQKKISMVAYFYRYFLNS